MNRVDSSSRVDLHLKSTEFSSNIEIFRIDTDMSGNNACLGSRKNERYDDRLEHAFISSFTSVIVIYSS